MKLLFDENISFKIKSLINKQYSERSHVSDLGKSLKSDREIWEQAKRRYFVIVTFDEDFFEIQQLYGFPPKIIWLRCGNTSTQNIAKLLNDNFERIHYHLSDENIGIIELH